MMTYLRKILIITFVFVLWQSNLSAQITAVGADYSKPTTFLRGQNDNIHVFFAPTTGSLQAAHTSGGVADFTWQKLDVALQSFTNEHTESSATVSNFSNISDGGYRVIADLGGLGTDIDTFGVWIIIDTFKIVDTIHYESACDWLDLEAKFRPVNNALYRIYQFESVGGTLYDSIIYNKITTEWTTSADISDGLDTDESWKKWPKTTVSEPAPLADATYTVTITDVFGKTVTAATPTIRAIAVYPAFEVEVFKDGNWATTTTYDDNSNDALYRVRFKHDGSKHATEYYWKGFGNIYLEQTRNVLIWSQTTSNLNEVVNPTVPFRGEDLNGYPTGRYGFQLVVRNRNSGCSDSTTLAYINVAPSSFPKNCIPNAFTPNGDGQNDVFTFVKGQEPKSMRTVKIQIFDRSGHKVYSYSGDYESWTGWNGKVNNDGSECTSGVYYYVISGVGWDDESYNDKAYRSFVHLFRD